jgi:hypothetical protein
MSTYFDVLAHLVVDEGLALSLEDRWWAIHAIQPESPHGVLITHAVYDPAGSDVRLEGGEFVVLENVGQHNADVSGWPRRDPVAPADTLPEARYLAPGGQLRVYIAEGTAAPGRVFAGRKRAVLDNRTPERVELRDRQGNLRHVMTWGAP